MEIVSGSQRCRPRELLQDHRRQGHACRGAAAPWRKGRLGGGEEFRARVCARNGADQPDRYLVNMTKKEREGRIYLDYLRNDRMATAVAVLSPRAGRARRSRCR